MAQRPDYTYWKTGLHQDSNALADLDTLAKELGVSRAEANRFLIVAFSKAKRGEWNPLFSGFQAQGYPTAGTTALQPQAARAPIPIRQDEKEVAVQARKNKGAGYAKALDLDDD